MPNRSFDKVIQERSLHVFMALYEYALTNDLEWNGLKVRFETNKDGLQKICGAKTNQTDHKYRLEISEHLSYYLPTFLGSLFVDRRTKRDVGAGDWKFDLTFWSENRAENIKRFNEEWEKKKSNGDFSDEPTVETLKSTPTNPNTTTPPTPQIDWLKIRRDSLDDRKNILTSGSLVHKQTASLDEVHVLGESDINGVPIWVGRDEPLEQLRQELIGQKKVIAIVGQGGMGKTSLAIKALEAMGVDLKTKTLTAECVYEYILFYKVKDNDGFDTVAAELLKVVTPKIEANSPQKQLEREAISPRETLSRIISGLTTHRCLVVLDNLESLLRAESSGQAKEIEIDNLLNRLVNAGHRSQIIITSRELPKGLEDPKFVAKLEIKGISTEASVELLQKLGLDDSEDDLQWIAEKVHGNIKILELLVNIGKGHRGYLRDHPDLVSARATPVIEAHFAYQSEPARILLRHISVLRIGAKDMDLATLRLIEPEGKVVKATPAQLSETREILKGLKAAGLVESVYDPSLREFFYTLDRLAQEVLLMKFAGELQQLYRCAARFYSSFESPDEYHCIEHWKVDLEKLHFQWLVGMYQDVSNIVVSTLFPKLDIWGYWNLQQEWCERILEHEQRREIRLKCNHVLGNVFQSRGELDRAANQFQLSLEQSVLDCERANSLSLLGSVSRKLGKWSVAIDYFSMSIKLWTELGNDSEIANVQTKLGYIEYQIGELGRAEKLFDSALEQTPKHDQLKIARIYGIKADINLARGDDESIEQAVNLSKLSREIREGKNNTEGIAITMRIDGDIQYKLGEYESAQDLYEKSLKIFQLLGDSVRIARLEGCLGKNALAQNKLRKATKHLVKAQKQMEDLKKLDGDAEISWYLARLYHAKDEPIQAQKYFDRAKRLYTQLEAKADLEKIDREWH